jgi:hypothetical protein
VSPYGGKTTSVWCRGRALVVGHSPTNEAAALGLTGQIVGPIFKGAGVLLVADDRGYRLEILD